MTIACVCALCRRSGWQRHDTAGWLERPVPPSHPREFCHLIASSRKGADNLDDEKPDAPDASSSQDRLIHVHINMYVYVVVDVKT